MLVVVFLNKQNPLLDYFRGQIPAGVNCVALNIFKCAEQLEVQGGWTE